MNARLCAASFDSPEGIQSDIFSSVFTHRQRMLPLKLNWYEPNQQHDIHVPKAAAAAASMYVDHFLTVPRLCVLQTLFHLEKYARCFTSSYSQPRSHYISWNDHHRITNLVWFHRKLYTPAFFLRRFGSSSLNMNFLTTVCLCWSLYESPRRNAKQPEQARSIFHGTQKTRSLQVG